MRWSNQLAKLPYELITEESPKVRESIAEWQDSVLDRFDRYLEQPIPMFCVRFRMDEALMALNVSRLLLKPIRVLTLVASWMVAIGGLLLLILWPLGLLVGLLTMFLDLVFRTNITDSVKFIYFIAHFAASSLFHLGIFPAILFLIIWTILGYVMGSMTLGHWGGIIYQLLVDFRITGTPEGASATSKVYSPLRWRRTLLHSLTYGDRNALAEISHWVASRMRDDAKISSPASGEDPGGV